MTAWFRTGDSRSQTVHIAGCPHCAKARRWSLVDGWSTPAVIEHIGKIPWLRICSACAKRLTLPDGHPALLVEDIPRSSAG